MKINKYSSVSAGSLVLALLILIVYNGKVFSQVVFPLPDHIVIAILENHSYTQIIGSSAAPNINALASDPYSALFTQSYAIEHPSQPNYLDLYSGSNQGVTNNELPVEFPFTTPNLGRQLIDAGKTFITYSEDLQEVGYNGATSAGYVRKHNPAANWMGTGTNQIPATTNQPLTAFPSTNFALLPTVCFVVPNQLNNMHDGTDPERITRGDNWIYDNFSSYIAWAKTHNSLFILTWDEDNFQVENRIVTIFTGQVVKAGEYADTINHYTILRTIEDIYGLPQIGNASASVPITNCWNLSNGENEPDPTGNFFSVYPNPASGVFRIQIESSRMDHLGNVEVFNVFGKKVFKESFPGSHLEEIHLKNISHGVYYVKVSDGKRMYTKKLIVK
ncbi:MAG: alkaline phosphatase family protein [Bacteroidales bacterium]